MTTRPTMSRRAFLAAAGAASLLACGDDEPVARASPRRLTFRYGDHPRQRADLELPTTTDAPVPVIVLLHGGFWQPPYDRALLRGLAEDLTDRGWAAWNLEYRPVGEGGGWPSTFADVAAGIDHLRIAARTHRLDLDRVVTLGHSAGGTLALWAAARPGLPAGSPGHAPEVEVMGAASVAGVNNLVSCWFEDLGRGACEALMGAPPDRDDRYQLASPENRLPLGLPQLLVYSAADAIVPAEQSTAYAAKAREAGDDVTILRAADADHFELVDPTHDEWEPTAEALTELLG